MKDHGDSSSRLQKKKNTLVYFNKLANNFKPLDRLKIKILEIERRFRRPLSLKIIDILQGSKKGRLQFAIFFMGSFVFTSESPSYYIQGIVYKFHFHVNSSN